MLNNIHDIGDGEYKVYYEYYIGSKTGSFIGECINFNPNGKCAFWNDEKKQLLLVGYREIMALYPI